MKDGGGGGGGGEDLAHCNSRVPERVKEWKGTF